MRGIPGEFSELESQDLISDQWPMKDDGRLERAQLGTGTVGQTLNPGPVEAFDDPYTAERDADRAEREVAAVRQMRAASLEAALRLNDNADKDPAYIIGSAKQFEAFLKGE